MKLAACAVAAAAVAWSADVQTFAVPMRDGIKLATDVYNADPQHPRPVLLIRTPYNKSGVRRQAEIYAARGYVVVAEDCRGRYASEGAYTPYNNDKQDGYDAIEWIHRQPWANGKVGMFGGSHTGLVQWLALAEGAPGLAVISPAFTASSLYGVAYRDRVLRLALISTGGVRASPAPPEKHIASEKLDVLYNDLPLMHLPIATLEQAYGWRLPWMTSLLEHPVRDGFWNQTSGEEAIAASTIPVQIVTGYYDMFLHDSVQDFFRLKARKSKAPIRLVLGPWTHGGTARSKLNGMDFGKAAAIDMDALNAGWFDRFLKHDGRGPALQVRYFVMGENTWHESDDWPPAGSQPLPLALDEMKTSRADSTFTSDPNDPVPSFAPARKDLSRVALWSPLDYSGVSARPDVLSFVSKPLEQRTLIAGPVEAELTVESDTPSADWVVRLFAVPSNGVALPLVQGVYRDEHAKGRHEVRVDLGSVAASVEAGGRFRVEIAGSNFPLYDRNPHTGEGPSSARTLVARQRVLRPSRLLLSVSGAGF